MRLNNAEILLFIPVLAAFVAGIFLFPSMSERMASHWDASGSVNGYAPRSVGVFLLPGILRGPIH